MTAPGQLGLPSTLSDLIILTKLYWAGRLVTWMQKLVFILTPWTSNLFRLNHSTILFSNKQDSVYILWRVFASKIKMQIPIINFFWLRIVRFHLVPPAAILDSGFNLCSIWKVSCIFRHKIVNILRITLAAARRIGLSYSVEQKLLFTIFNHVLKLS